MIRKISVCLALTLSLSNFTAVSAEWDGTLKEPQFADGVYIINNAEELAWFSESVNSGNNDICAELQGNIDLSGNEWSQIGTAANPYIGRLAGNGYEISGISEGADSGTYHGMFGYIGAGGEVRNLTVSGTVSSSESSGYAGGIAGYNEGTIAECVANIVVSGKKYAGGIAGYNAGKITACINNGNISSVASYSYTDGIGGIAGYNKGEISYSANNGNISNVNNSYCYYTGGIAGRVSGDMQIASVYNTGDVSGYNIVGGIVGGAEGSGAVRYAYSLGTITCKYSYSSASKGGIAGKTPSYMCEYAYFLQTEDVNDGLKAVGSGLAQNSEGRTGTQLKEESFLPLLGGAFEADLDDNINLGYPILKWQNPDSVYKIELKVVPSDSQVILHNYLDEQIGGSLETDENLSVYTFSGLEKGEYRYSVSQEEGDYEPQNGTLTVNAADIYQTIELEKRRYKVIVEVEPNTADFELRQGEKVLTPDSASGDGYEYSLENGNYICFASAFGYADFSEDITVNRGELNKEINLVRLPCSKVVISLRDMDSGIILYNTRIQLKCGEYLLTAEADGSWLLPKGTYDYVIKRTGYAKAAGSFEVTDGDLETEKIVEAETFESLVWDGDSDEPEYRDGVWQISTGNELAWFAEFVNGTQTSSVLGASQDAVLNADIDLGGGSWTPIGAKAGYTQKTYNGVFDGNGRTVKGLNINSAADCQGFFGKTAAAAHIKNLTLEGNVKNTSSSGYYTGGICGYNQGEIINCVNNADVAANGSYSGGICGYSSGGSISGCVNNGLISYETGTGQYKGGIAGEVRYTEVSQCVNAGSVEANGTYAGGLAGRIYSGTAVSDSFNKGAVSSNAYTAGGFAGGTYGSNSNIRIENCYSIGEVKNSPGNCGAFIGYYNGGTVSNCYCLIEKDSGINSALNGVGGGTVAEGAISVIALAEAAGQIFDALNVNKVWKQNNYFNGGAPYLFWQSFITKTITIDEYAVDMNNLIIPSGEHSISVKYDADVNGAGLFMGVFENGKLGNIITGTKGDYNISGDYNFKPGSVVKIFFWDDMLPVDAPVEIKVD